MSSIIESKLSFAMEEVISKVTIVFRRPMIATPHDENALHSLVHMPDTFKARLVIVPDHLTLTVTQVIAPVTNVLSCLSGFV